MTIFFLTKIKRIRSIENGQAEIIRAIGKLKNKKIITDNVKSIASVLIIIWC